MASSLTHAPVWAQEEFSKADLSDGRRTKRLVKAAAALAQRPSGTLPGAIKDIKDVKAAYKFFSNPEVTYDRVIAPHFQHTQSQTALPGEYLLVEDGSTLDFTTHWAAKGLGRIGNDGGRGLNLHSTLALRIMHWQLNQPIVDILGLWSQHVWERTGPSRRGWESKRQRLERPRESELWAQALTATNGPPAGARWTYIADRESDIYEVFEHCTDRAADFIVRASRPRALADDDQSIFGAAAAAPLLGHYDVHLRARPGQPARTAGLGVRATTVTIRAPWRPSGRPPALQLNVVEALETGAPVGASPVHWVLLTTWSIATFDDARKIIAAYECRWLIEEYHKALKTGTEVEKSQLATAPRLKALLGILAVVAVRLLRLKLLTQIDPDQPIMWDEETSAMRTILEVKVGKPKQGWTNRTLLITIAKFGGFLGRKSDGNPGWITLWRGVKELMLLAEGFEIAGAFPK